MSQHLIIQFLLYYLSSGRLRLVKNKRKFQTFRSKSSLGRLQEVVAYKRIQMQWFDLETFGILENWSLRRGGRLRENVATGGSTVFSLRKVQSRTIFIHIICSFNYPLN